MTPLAEPKGRAGDPATFSVLAPPTWVTWRLTEKHETGQFESFLKEAPPTLGVTLTGCWCAGANRQRGGQLHGSEGRAGLGGTS